MDLTEILPSAIVTALEEPQFQPGGAREAIEKVATTLGLVLPEDYVEFLVRSNGAEFFLGETCVILFAIDDIEAETPSEDEFPAHFRVFGTNGGAEVFAFDVRSKPHPIVLAPHHEPTPADVIVQGTTLTELLERVATDQLFD